MWSTLYCMMMSSQPMGMSKGGALGGFSLVVGWLSSRTVGWSRGWDISREQATCMDRIVYNESRALLRSVCMRDAPGKE